MNIELTEKMIQDAFAKTGIDQKYYPQYEAEAKRRYEALQKENPDYEESPDEDNAHSSINLTNEYMVYYVAEIEKGHCHEWSHSYALYSIWPENEYTIVSNALDSLKNDERKKELELHAKTIKKDPIFVDVILTHLKKAFKNLERKLKNIVVLITHVLRMGKASAMPKTMQKLRRVENMWRSIVGFMLKYTTMRINKV